MMIFRQILDYLDAPPPDAFDQAPQEAVSFFRNKGLRTTFRYTEMIAKEHTEAFTIAKMVDIDLLSDVYDSIDKAIADGDSFEQWSKTIKPRLERAGWVGTKLVTDPDTGRAVVANLGTPSRLQTIFRTNVQTAYAAGQWDQIVDQAESMPYLMYHAIDDSRTRATHRALDGKIYRIDDPFWRLYYPPNGYNCRCGVIQLDDDQLEELGLSVSAKHRTRLRQWKNPNTGQIQSIPNDIDPGWAYNPGTDRGPHLEQVMQQKIEGLAPELRSAARKGMQATEAAQAAINPASYDFALD